MGISQSHERNESVTSSEEQDVDETNVGFVDVNALTKKRGSIPVSGRYSNTRDMEDEIEVLPTILGTGGSGPVTLAKDRNSNRYYAVKSFKLLSLSSIKREELKNEVSMALVLDHPHIVKLESVYETQEWLHLVLEYMAGGELLKRLGEAENRQFTEQRAAKTARQMLLALAYLHSHNIVHRDLKLENWLYEQEDSPHRVNSAQDAIDSMPSGQSQRDAEVETADVPLLPAAVAGSEHLKLVDFGFAKFWDGRTPMRKSCGTPAYVAPEVLGKKYTEKADMWSFGVIVYMLLTGRALWPGETADAILNNIRHFKLHFSRRFTPLSSNAKAFVEALICKDPKDRKSAAELLQHPFLTQTHVQASAPVDGNVLKSFLRFAHASRFRRACLSMMAWSLGSEDRRALREHFLALDEESRGVITLHQFTAVIEKEYHIDSLEASQLFHSLDADGDEEISYSEFLAAAMCDHVLLHNDVLVKTFQRFDPKMTGLISVDNLRAVLGDSFENSDVEDLLREADSDRNGVVNIEEFLAFLREEPVEEAPLEEGMEKTESDGAAIPVMPARPLAGSQTSSSASSVKALRRQNLLLCADQAIHRLMSESSFTRQGHPVLVGVVPLRRRMPMDQGDGIGEYTMADTRRRGCSATKRDVKTRDKAGAVKSEPRKAAAAGYQTETLCEYGPLVLDKGDPNYDSGDDDNHAQG